MKTNKWKLALLIWSAMFPFSTIISYVLSQVPFVANWPLVARTFCLTCLLVPYMVCLALPFLTRRFQGWLQQNPPSTPNPPGSDALSRIDQPDVIPSGTPRVSGQQYAL